MYVHAYLCLCVDICIWVQVAWESRKGHQILERELQVVGGCDLPCQCWELSPGAPKDQQALWTAEPSFQTLVKRVSLLPCVQRKEHKGTVKMLEKIIIKHLHKLPCCHQLVNTRKASNSDSCFCNSWGSSQKSWTTQETTSYTYSYIPHKNNYLLRTRNEEGTDNWPRWGCDSEGTGLKGSRLHASEEKIYPAASG